MTVPLAPANDIRLVDAAGRSRSEITRTFHVSRIAVAEYDDMSNISLAAPLRQRSASPALERNEGRFMDALVTDREATPNGKNRPLFIGG